jgi:hypothetical protein
MHELNHNAKKATGSAQQVSRSPECKDGWSYERISILLVHRTHERAAL